MLILKPSLKYRFLQKFYTMLYHSFAWGYDFISWIVSAGRWQGWAKTILPLVEGRNFLEIGCGTGNLLLELYQRGDRVIGLDESGHMLRIAKNTTLRKWGASVAALVRARAETLPLPDTCLDSVVATFPGEYIFRIDTLQSCRRVLVPGGRLIILLGVQFGGRSVIDIALRWLYAVTGQSTPEKPALECGLDRLRECGFEGRMVKLNFQQDTLTAFVAENSLL